MVNERPGKEAIQGGSWKGLRAGDTGWGGKERCESGGDGKGRAKV